MSCDKCGSPTHRDDASYPLDWRNEMQLNTRLKIAVSILSINFILLAMVFVTYK